MLSSGTQYRTLVSSDRYRSIARFSVETAGSFDRDAEFNIWITDASALFQIQFNKKLSIYAVQSVLASYVVR